MEQLCLIGEECPSYTAALDLAPLKLSSLRNAKQLQTY